MKCQKDIQDLAEERFLDAELLMKNNRFDTAYYFAGYVIELLLKARVCKTLGIDNFFDDNSPAKILKYGQSTYKVHNFNELIILSGLYTELINEQQKDINFLKHWSFVCEWNEGSRYLTGKLEQDTLNFLTSIIVIKQWIEKYL